MIQKIMATYNYDRENAEKVLEYMRVKRVETIWGSACGAFAAWKMGPIQKELEHSHVLFRKAWMRVPLQVTAFCTAYWLGTQLPTRLFKKFTTNNGVNNDTYTGEHDYVSRFRLWEHSDAQAEGHKSVLESNMLDYLATYSEDPLSEPELIGHLAEKYINQVDVGKLYQVRRLGKDLDDTYFMLGKVHGLENIKFIPDDELAKIKNPVEL